MIKRKCEMVKAKDRDIPSNFYFEPQENFRPLLGIFPNPTIITPKDKAIKMHDDYY